MRTNVSAAVLAILIGGVCLDTGQAAEVSNKSNGTAPAQNTMTSPPPTAVAKTRPVSILKGKPFLTSSDCRLHNGTVVVAADDRCGSAGAPYCKGANGEAQCIEDKP